MSTAVVMAVYNGEKYLQEQLESIASQSVRPDRILAADDGSSDQSLEILRSFRDRHPELNMEIISRTENVGYRENFRLLLADCTEDWIFLCDQDDRWHPDKAEIMLKTVAEHPEIQLLCSGFEFMNQSGEVYHVAQKPGWSNQNLLPRPLKPEELTRVSLDEMVMHNYFQGCSMLVSARTAKSCLQALPDLLPHDWRLALAAAAEHGLYFLNIPLFDYRIHENNTIGMLQSRGLFHGLWFRIRKLLSEENRTVVVRQSSQAIRTLYAMRPDLKNGRYDELLDYAERNMAAIQSSSAVEIWQLRNHPAAGKYKSALGRTADLICCLTERGRKNGQEEQEQ